MIELLAIPEERKAVLIGREGRIKAAIEKKTSTKMEINADVKIQGEPLDVMKAREVVRAIGRGFSPTRAFKLLEDFQLSVISLSGTHKKVKRLLSRVIGSEGKCRKTLEELTGCWISIYGKTVSIIGPPDRIGIAYRAVEDLLSGKPHANVYRGITR